jgi:hypothetical protein
MDRVFFDYSKLSGRIREKYGSQKAFAKALGMSEAALSNKMTGIYYFTQPEIKKSVKLLELDPGSVTDYFFTPRIKKSKQRGDYHDLG